MQIPIPRPAAGRDRVRDRDQPDEHEDRRERAERDDDEALRHATAAARSPPRAATTSASSARPMKNTSLPSAPVCQPITAIVGPASRARVPAGERREREHERPRPRSAGRRAAQNPARGPGRPPPRARGRARRCSAEEGSGDSTRASICDQSKRRGAPSAGFPDADIPAPCHVRWFLRLAITGLTVGGPLAGRNHLGGCWCRTRRAICRFRLTASSPGRSRVARTRWARAGWNCTSGTWATSAPTRPTRRRPAGSCVRVAPT